MLMLKHRIKMEIEVVYRTGIDPFVGGCGDDQIMRVSSVCLNSIRRLSLTMPVDFDDWKFEG